MNDQKAHLNVSRPIHTQFLVTMNHQQTEKRVKGHFQQSLWSKMPKL